MNRPRLFTERLERREARHQEHQAERVRPDLLRVADVDRRKREEQPAGDSGDRSEPAAREKDREADRDDAGKNARKPPGPLGRARPVQEGLHEVIERRMHALAFRRGEHPRPWKARPAHLVDLVVAEREASERVAAQGRSEEKDAESGGDVRAPLRAAQARSHILHVHVGSAGREDMRSAVQSAPPRTERGCQSSSLPLGV